MGNNHSSKKQQFTQPKKSRTSLYLGIIVVIIVLGVGGFFVLGGKKDAMAAKTPASIGQSVSYSPGQQLQQTVVPNTVENGKVTVASLSNLKQSKFVWTEYKANGKDVPLTAVVQPNGKVVVAVSYCEPCKGKTFHITGNKIVCNTCGTEWDLQTFKGISGGCQAYPPDALTYSVEGDNLVIPQTVLDSWTPRV
ncbi:MAG: DUF2318 domain-containing protein [Desulfitobacteriaceae bacterium]|nr:DUF2318 domain-containing protein [Desulfitobacteriaceae bacterium]